MHLARIFSPPRLVFFSPLRGSKKYYETRKISTRIMFNHGIRCIYSTSHPNRHWAFQRIAAAAAATAADDDDGDDEDDDDDDDDDYDDDDDDDYCIIIILMIFITRVSIPCSESEEL